MTNADTAACEPSVYLFAVACHCVCQSRLSLLRRGGVADARFGELIFFVCGAAAASTCKGCNKGEEPYAHTDKQQTQQVAIVTTAFGRAVRGVARSDTQLAHGKTWEAARLVFVDGLSRGQASARLRLSYSTVRDAVGRCMRTFELAQKVVVPERGIAFEWERPLKEQGISLNDYEFRVWYDPVGLRDGCFLAQVIGWNCIMGDGQTPDEAVRMAREVLEMVIECCLEDGDRIVRPVRGDRSTD